MKQVISQTNHSHQYLVMLFLHKSFKSKSTILQIISSDIRDSLLHERNQADRLILKHSSAVIENSINKQGFTGIRDLLVIE
jgi:hypothetical protein